MLYQLHGFRVASLATIISLVLTLSLFSLSYGQESSRVLGFPYHTHYTPDDFGGHNQILSISQDDDGFIYFGNAFYGIIYFDGTTWNRVRTPGFAVRNVFHASNGIQYVGGPSHFGYIYHDENGTALYESLHTRLEEEIADFGQIISIFEFEGDIWFGSFENLYRLNPETKDITSIQSDYRFMQTMSDGERVFTTKQQKAGVFELRDGEFYLIEDSEHIEGEVIRSVLQTKSGKTLLLFTSHGFKEIDETSLMAYPTEMDDLRINQEVRTSHATVLHDGNIAISTSTHGVYVITEEGQIREHYTSENALLRNQNFFVFQSNDGSLWAGAGGGISHLDYASPYRLLRSESGIESTINDITDLDGTIYLGGPGLLKMQGHEITEITHDLIGSSVFSVANIDNQLFAGTSQGLVKYNPQDGSVVAVTSGIATEINVLRSIPTELLLTKNTGIKIIQKQNGYWEETLNYSDFNSNVMYALELQNGDLLVIELDRSLHHLKRTPGSETFELKSVNVYKDTDLPDGAANLAHIEGEDLLIYDFVNPAIVFPKENSEENGFSLDIRQTSSISQIFENRLRMRAMQDGTNDYFEFYPRFGNRTKDPKTGRWYFESNDLILMADYQDGSWTVPDETFWLLRKKPSRTEVVLSMHATNDHILMGGRGILWSIERNFPDLEIPETRAHIRTITAISDTIQVFSNGLMPESFEVGTRELRFDFTTTPIIDPSAVYYRYKLEGYENWSPWTQQTFKEYNNLRHGSYRLHIQSVDVYHRKSPAMVYSFVIQPPLHLTTTAFLIYGLIFMGFIGLLLQIRARYAEKALRIEFEQEKKEIEENRIKQELKDARDFQLSMLPDSHPDWAGVFFEYSMETATEVGGDYYDFLEGHDGAKIAVIGDASGHGTSAGMMVSITKATLNSIRATSPADALKQVNNVLKKVNRNNLNMALSIIEISDDKLLVSSAAMPPFYFYSAKKDTLEEISIIGLPLGSIRNANYQEMALPFEKGDFALFMTDGLVEITNENKDILGYEALLEFLKNHPKDDAKKLFADLNDLGKSWSASKDERHDDMTFLFLKKE